MKKYYLIVAFSLITYILQAQELKIKTNTDRVNISKDPPIPPELSIIESSFLFKDADGNNAIDTNVIADFRDGEDDIEMVYIEGRSFTMGSPLSESDRGSSETQHQVKVSSFYMGKYEVTQKQWKAVMGSNPSYFSDCDNCPVELVSWNDVQEFIKKLNAKTGKTYRLPTEAEWEYACRAGTTGPFNTGNCLNTEQANYDGNYPYASCSKGQYRQKTTPVGSFAPNTYGLYDMHGNVWEWCQDWYGSYSSDSQTNPQGPSTGSGRVIRGGSCLDSALHCRSAYRGNDSPGSRYYSLGFRIIVPK